MSETNKEYGWLCMPPKWIKKIFKGRELKSAHFGFNADGKSYLLFKFTDDTETRVDEDGNDRP